MANTGGKKVSLYNLGNSIENVAFETYKAWLDAFVFATITQTWAWHGGDAVVGLLGERVVAVVRRVERRTGRPESVVHEFRGCQGLMAALDALGEECSRFVVRDARRWVESRRSARARDAAKRAARDAKRAEAVAAAAAKKSVKEKARAEARGAKRLAKREARRARVAARFAARLGREEWAVQQ